MTMVLDASIALDWCFDSERSAYAESVLDAIAEEGAAVPAIWPAEVANGLLSALRRGRITQAGIEQALALISELNITVVAHDWRLEAPSLLRTGFDYALSAYDAAYLALAAGQGLALATNDQAMRAAAGRAGVPLFGVPSAAVSA